MHKNFDTIQPGDKVLVVTNPQRGLDLHATAKLGEVASVGARELRLVDGSRWIRRNGHPVGSAGGWHLYGWLENVTDDRVAHYAKAEKHNARVTRIRKAHEALRELKVDDNNLADVEALIAKYNNAKE